MYITDIYLTNFQSYEEGHFELSEKVNLITGASDSGKTALIRALSWVLFNDYTTDLLIRNGYNNVEVKIVFDNGNYILRGRKGNTNYYHIKNNPDHEEIKEYVNFGREIPTEIQDDFMFKKVNLLNEKYNILISSQLENSFLLSETDSTKANAIGKLVNVDILDNASRSVSREIKSKRSELNFKKDLIKEKEQYLTKYDYLSKEKHIIDNLKSIYNNLAKNYEQLNILKTLSSKLSELNIRINNGYKYLDKYKGLDVCNKTLELTQNNISSYVKLNKFYENYKELLNAIEFNNRKLNSLKNTNLITSIVENLEKNITLIKFLNPLYNSFTYVNINIKNYETKLLKLKNISKSQNLLSNTEKNIQELTILSDLNQNFNTINKDIINKRNLLKNLKTNSVSEIITQIDINNEKYIKLYQLNSSYQSIGNKISIQNDILNKLKSIDNSENLLIKIYKSYELITKLKLIKSAYDENQKSYEQNAKLLDQCNNVIERLIQEYAENLYKEKICPFCLSEIDENHVIQIVKELKK